MEQTEELEEKYEDLIPKAIIFAFNAHSGQYRKVHPHQYIIHPLRVSEFLLKNFRLHPNLNLMRAAAVLHDTIEDTWVSEKDIEQQFGKKIAELVVELTHPEIEDKTDRLNNYIKLLITASDEAKIIKLADIFDNVVLSTDNHPRWKTFLKDKKIMLSSIDLKEKNSTYDKIKAEVLSKIDEKLKQYE
jgi:(p)ppGpp synthase/HD superfamily hydrolase